MLKSMTGFAKAQKTTTFGLLTCELHSVNRKSLEIKTYLPKALLFLDAEIKKWIQMSISRGSIYCHIHLQLEKEHIHVHLNDIALEKLHTSLKKSFAKLKLDLDATAFATLFNKEDLFTIETKINKPDLLKKELKGVLGKALKELCQIKQDEGKNLQKDIEKQFVSIHSFLKQIEKQAKSIFQATKKKFLDRLKEWSKTKEDQERLFKEAALLCERADITEEIVRLHSHLKEVTKLIKSKESLGKTIEFFIQEMNRETNTISQKSNSVNIAQKTILIKSHLEKIREQIQNVE
ncbi:MAG: hypothetical protein K940chlam8_01297 [Chlamydiae bacterium]|nr:hypothetical protein [Chlamydiota bacterium]